MNASISRQLIFWLAVPLLLLALGGAFFHYFNNLAPSVIDSDRRLKDAVGALMAHLQIQNGNFSLDASPERTPALPGRDSVIYVIRDSQNRPLLGDAILPPIVMAPDISQLQALIPVDGRNLRTLTTRLDTPMGLIFISVADMRRAGEPAARFGLMSTLLWDFAQLNLTLVLVWVGIQLGLRPMRKLREAIAARSPLDLRPFDAAAVPREIAPLVVTLNRLFQMLRSSTQSQQQFIANTAHQLRTPITGMQAQLDLLAAEPAAAPIRERLRTLQEGARQLAHSANQLLTLARADPSVNLATKNQTVALDTIVAEVAARFFDRALGLDIDFGVDVDPVSIHADPSLLDDLLSNLVDNALKYTPAGGRVTVSTGRHLGRPYLSVDDTGAGIPEDERQRVRQRFYRIANSPGHGSGLGLAIVDEIAQLYDASVIIGSGPDGLGTHIQVLFK